MSHIHDTVMDYVHEALEDALIWAHGEGDPAIAGVVQKGPLQGDPAPDDARISVTIHENDPDTIYDAQDTSIRSDWSDEVVIIETSQVITWARRFSVKARCLLVNTQEPNEQAREIASTVRTRIENTLVKLSWNGVVADDGEYVSRGVIAPSLKSEVVQAGGPGSYDYHIKVRFDVLTTTKGVTQ